MKTKISGLSRTSLWRAWKAVRGELKRASVRDAIDHLEYDIDPDKWINALLRDISFGRYEPDAPLRFTEAKGNGFSRRMTMPSVPDIVLFRTIVDHVYRKAKRFEIDNVFCERTALPKNLQDAAQDVSPILKGLKEQVTDYATSSTKQYRAWLLYNQYRKWLVFRKIHKFVVITDITNYFDSILYGRVSDSFHSIRVAPGMVGLLFFLLERLSIRDAYSESPRIGLPVDEFACSRKLAHMVLFPHDDRMLQGFGAGSYVRWMDDQNFGVASRAEGLRCLAVVSDSLSRLHLTANSKKSVILSISEARRHFHFDINDRLDRLERMSDDKASSRAKVRVVVRVTWKMAQKYEGRGQWDKILKRFYRIAGRYGMRFLRRRAILDVLKTPTLVRRVCEYVRATGTVTEYLDFVRALWTHPEQVYGDVNATLFESFLRLEPDAAGRSMIRMAAVATMKDAQKFDGVERCRALAPLLILRYGDGRSLRTLWKCLSPAGLGRTSREVSRASAIVLAGTGPSHLHRVRKIAGQLHRNDLGLLARMVDAIERYQKVPERWALRCKPGYDPVTGARFVDMRGIVALRLLGTNSAKPVRAWLADKKKGLRAQKDLSAFDQDLIRRLWPA